MYLGDHRNIARKVHGDPHETEFGCKALELYSVAFRCLAKYDGLKAHLINLLKTANNAVEFLDSAVSRYKEEEFPVPEGDSLEGLMEFPFVCDCGNGGESAGTVLQVSHRALQGL